MNEFDLDFLEVDEEKLEKLRNGGGEVVEDSGDDCESGACKI